MRTVIALAAIGLAMLGANAAQARTWFTLNRDNNACGTMGQIFGRHDFPLSTPADFIAVVGREGKQVLYVKTFTLPNDGRQVDIKLIGGSGDWLFFSSLAVCQVRLATIVTHGGNPYAGLTQ
ncbi:MAG: hypothetical protein ACRELG_02345 [Gemmataceae bacterium]